MSAQSSKLVDGRKVVGRFDSYTFPPKRIPKSPAKPQKLVCPLSSGQVKSPGVAIKRPVFLDTLSGKAGRVFFEIVLDYRS